MAHEIEDNKAFFTNRPAWHGLGTVLSTAPTIQEAWQLAYPHELFKLPLQATVPGTDAVQAVDSHKAIFRDDGKLIGVVGEGYELVQPHSAFKFFEPFIESGLVDLEAGGSLRDGSRMWALAKIKDAEQEVLKGDPIKGYFLVYTSFDGSLAHGVKFTGTRVVCANTLAMARKGTGASFTLKHTKNIHERINQIQKQVDIARQSFTASIDTFRELARKQVNDAWAEAYVREVFDAVPVPGEKEISPQLETKVSRVIDLLDCQRGLELVPAMRGTAWQCYNAVTDYLTHEAGRTDDTRLNSQWFGQSANTSSKALDLALTR